MSDRLYATTGSMPGTLNTGIPSFISLHSSSSFTLYFLCIFVVVEDLRTIEQLDSQLAANPPTRPRASSSKPDSLPNVNNNAELVNLQQRLPLDEAGETSSARGNLIKDSEQRTPVEPQSSDKGQFGLEQRTLTTGEGRHSISGKCLLQSAGMSI